MTPYPRANKIYPPPRFRASSFSPGTCSGLPESFYHKSRVQALRQATTVSYYTIRRRPHLAHRVQQNLKQSTRATSFCYDRYDMYHAGNPWLPSLEMRRTTAIQHERSVVHLRPPPHPHAKYYWRYDVNDIARCSTARVGY